MPNELRIHQTMTDPGVDLSGKVVLITGASRGVGASAAGFAARAGADIAINYRSKARRAEQVAEQVRAADRRAIIVPADLTDYSAVDAMFDQTIGELGHLDVVVLNASGGLEKDMPDDYGMMLNRDAQLHAATRAIENLPSGGVLVFVTSHLAHFHGQKPVMDVYEVVAASKRAGETALRDLMPRMTEKGVRFVVVSGDLIDGTITPKLLDRMRKHSVIADRREQAGWLPTTDDFAAAIIHAAGRDDLDSGATVYVGSTEW